MNQSLSDELKVIVFRLHSQEYGVDVNQVKSIERMQHITKTPQSPDFVRGVINLRGVVTPIIDLRSRLELPVDNESESTRIIIVGLDGLEIGLIVDSANDVIDIPSNAVEAAPKIVTGINVSYIRGVAKLGERLLILLDLNKILNSHELKIIEEIGND